MKKTFVYDTETGKIFGPDLTIEDIIKMLQINGISVGACEVSNVYGHEEPVIFDLLSKKTKTIAPFYGVNLAYNIACITLENLLDQNRVQFLIDELTNSFSLIVHDLYDLQEIQKAFEFIVEMIKSYPLEDGDIPEPIIPDDEEDEDEGDDEEKENENQGNGGTELEEEEEDDFTW